MTGFDINLSSMRGVVDLTALVQKSQEAVAPAVITNGAEAPIGVVRSATDADFQDVADSCSLRHVKYHRFGNQLQYIRDPVAAWPYD